MGANEKYEAAMHGVPSEVRMNDDLTRIKLTYADAMRAKTGVGTATFDAEFDRFIAKIKAAAWDEGREAGSENQIHWNGNWYTGGHEEITNPYKETPSA